MLAGHQGYQHDDVYEDGDTIVFLARPATLLGYCLVAPEAQLESWLDEVEG